MSKVGEYSVVHTVLRCLGSRRFVNYKAGNCCLAVGTEVVGIQAAGGQDANIEAAVYCLVNIEGV